MAYALPAFRAFVKRADRRAQTRCELKAWGAQFGLDGIGLRVAYIDVVPSHAYKIIARPAIRAGHRLQIGLQFQNGRRVLLTGLAKVQLPVMAGTQVLERIRMDVERIERFRAKRRTLRPKG